MWFIKEKFKKMNIHEAKKMMDENTVTVVDVRDEDSFNTSHIQGAILISDSNVEKFVQEADKQIPLICYCYHGISSQSAAIYFQNNGFEQVYSVDGGFEAWKDEYPTVND